MSRSDDKRPQPPAILADAIQDVAHTDIGGGRAANSVKVDAAFIYRNRIKNWAIAIRLKACRVRDSRAKTVCVEHREWFAALELRDVIAEDLFGIAEEMEGSLE